RTTTKGEYERWAKDCKYIQFLPDDVNATSLPGIVNAILTVYGNAGLEYSCFGIPCILGGESLYSGYGFTHEPRTQEEYFKLLKNAHTLKPLNSSQIEKAKVYSYIYLVLSRVQCNFVPEFSIFNDYDEAKFWEDATALVKKNKPEEDKFYKMLQIQIGQNRSHLLNYDWVGL
ncbi:MAG: hypothetical protein ACYSSI_13940, partial [Planctomycetota bacterium]